MPKLEIQVGEDNPILRRKSKKVGKFDASLKKFVKEMKKVMMSADGLGLAAPQVGRNIRIIIVTLGYKTKNPMVTVMVNPEIVEFSKETAVYEEGCLSLPGVYAKVRRPKEVVLEYEGLDGSAQVLRLKGLNSRVVQHEIDHLDAILFIDRVKKGQEKKVMEM